MKTYNIAVFAGDGIGPEVIGQAIRVLEAAQHKLGGFQLEMTHLPWGAEHWGETGRLVPTDFLDVLGGFDAILFGALKMEEAYRAVEWRVIFLVAALLPVGIAMERTGAALLLADGVTAVAGSLGPYAILAALILLSSLLSQALDGAPAVVLLTPVALQAAERLDLSPYPIMMGVGLAASAAFMTPFSHKANLLVMSAGGYKAIDYIRIGTPLTIVLLVLLVLLIPVFFPF